MKSKLFFVFHLSVFRLKSGKFFLMLNKELGVAIDLARRASALILGFYEKGVEAEEKIGADNFPEPVTIADRLSSELIVEGLKQAFPGDGILSEEAFDSGERLTKNRVWMIDPIDGTKGFIEKTGDFAVQIGLAENGAAVLGVVLLPLSDVLYFAMKDCGAFQATGDGAPERLHVSNKTGFGEMILATSRNHRSPKMARVLQSFGLKREIRRGSVGLKVGLIVGQNCDLYIHLSPRTKFWDTCAPQIILEEAGGKMTDLFGAKINYNQRDVQNHNGVIASNGVSHFETLEKLKPLLNEFGRLRVRAKSN